MVSDSIRLRFSKKGYIRFISHLDIINMIEHAFNRAGIELKHSQGFNPRPKLSFTLPLSLGFESECEYVDAQLAYPLDTEEVLDAMNSATPDGILFDRCYVPERKLTEISRYGYRMEIEGSVADEVEAYFLSPSPIEKKSKSGKVKIIDTKKLIFSYNIYERNGKTVVEAVLGGGAENFLNPETLLKEAIDISKYEFHITRTSAFLADGAEFE